MHTNVSAIVITAREVRQTLACGVRAMWATKI